MFVMNLLSMPASRALATSLVLVALFAMATHSAPLDEKAILSKLEDIKLAPDETLQLIKSLGPNHRGEESGIQVKQLLEFDKIIESKCGPDNLMALHAQKSAMAYDLGDLEAIFGYLNDRFAKQLELCADFYDNKLESHYLSKLAKGARKRVELFDKFAAANKSPGEQQAELGPFEADEALHLAQGQVTAELKRQHDAKLMRTPKSKKKIARGLKEACEDAAAKLKPVAQFVELARAAQVDLKHPELARWQQIQTHCDQFNRRYSADLYEEVDDFEPLL